MFGLSVLLTNNQLLHLLPLNVIPCFMSDGDCDPPLNALWSQERRREANQFITGAPFKTKNILQAEIKELIGLSRLNLVDVL